MNFKIFILVITVFTISIACTKKVHYPEPSFYYWKTIYKLSSIDSSAMKVVNVKKLYIRFFDVDFNPALDLNMPVGEIKYLNLDKNIQLIPVIFITKRALLNEPLDKITKLAEMINSKINSILVNRKINEIQFDCDWTEKTRLKYFNLLEEIKKLNKGINITVTIRLHQIKFAKTTGIPPVKRGTLMVYNIDQVSDEHVSNSIFNLKSYMDYSESINSYPLDIDVALPIFCQGVLFRDGKARYLIANVSEPDFDDKTIFTKTQNDFYLVKKSIYFKGNYIYEKDKIRLEYVNYKDLTELCKNLSDNINNKNLSVIFFQLDSNNLKRYGINEIKSLLNYFH